MKPTWTSRRPAATSAFMIASPSACVVASGFSQNTGLPASIAVSTCSAWVCAQEVTSTASTAGSATRSRPDGCTVTPVSAAAADAARAASTSVTAVTAPPDTTWVIRRM